MTKEVSKELRIIGLRNGVEISIERDRVDAILPELEKRRFFEVNGEIINTKDIVGIFTPQAIEDTTRRKNGQWQDKKTGKWYNKGDRICSNCGTLVPYGKMCGNCR